MAEVLAEGWFDSGFSRHPIIWSAKFFTADSSRSGRGCRAEIGPATKYSSVADLRY